MYEPLIHEMHEAHTVCDQPGDHAEVVGALFNFEAGLLESWYNLRRAGASYIITYGARLARGLGLPK